MEVEGFRTLRPIVQLSLWYEPVYSFLDFPENELFIKQKVTASQDGLTQVMSSRCWVMMMMILSGSYQAPAVSVSVQWTNMRNYSAKRSATCMARCRIER